mmetsp:Transcript_1386/g.1498  ORF Transcript_1386/g.1498 Transcript_1386/m.1498 type:complete len:336 (-) Transcript_1386:406-1413(-)
MSKIAKTLRSLTLHRIKRILTRHRHHNLKPPLPTPIHPLLILKRRQRRKPKPLHHLIRRKQRFLHRIPNLHIIPLLSRDGPPDVNEIPPPIDFDDSGVLDGVACPTHPSRHFLPFEDTSGVLALTGGSEGTVGAGGTVCGGHAFKIPFFHGTLEAFALGDTGYIHILSGYKVSCVYGGSRCGKILPVSDSKFSYEVGWISEMGGMHILLPFLAAQTREVFFIMSHNGRFDVLPLACPGTELYTEVPILLLGKRPQHDVRIHKQNGTRMPFAPFIPNGHHTHLDGQSTTSSIEVGDPTIGVVFIGKVFEFVCYLEGTFAVSGFPIGVEGRGFFGFL